MAEATLTSPLTLDPRQAIKLRVRMFKAEDAAGTVNVVIDYVDSGGIVVKTDSDQLTGAPIATWISNQESTILTRYLAKKGLAGTVA